MVSGMVDSCLPGSACDYRSERDRCHMADRNDRGAHDNVTGRVPAGRSPST